jgi:membrane-bound lytic murein transglycosylase A
MRKSSAIIRLFSVCALLASSGCAFFKSADHFESRPLAFEALNGWAADHHAQALDTFLASCPMLTAKARKASSGSGLEVNRSVWQSLCSDAMLVPRDNNLEARAFFERRFVPYRIANNGKETGLFTGYYVPTLYGSTKHKGQYTYPLYQVPPDLKNKKPYFTHAQISGGALAKRGLELVWVDDPVMLFFMQIQGSGRVRFSDGKEILVGYAGQNGHKYMSLGKIMGDEGLLPKDQINFYTIRQWLYDHPERAFELMQRNPSYVFFKRLDVTGAVGAVGAVLTKQRSLAVDNNYIPYGLPLFVETELPALPQAQPTVFQRLAIAQDTGGAIKSPVRADIFFGEGSQAEYLAGYMKGRGVYSLLVPKEMVDQMH